MHQTRTRSTRTTPQIKDNRRLSFYAAIFDEPTTVYDFKPGGEKIRTEYREVIRPGAFHDTLSTDLEVIANIDHDKGRTFAQRSNGQLLIQEDRHGLYCSTWLPETELGDAVLEDVKAGRLDATSFRFKENKWEWADGDLCELLSVSLHDVCLTDSPAYPGTRGEVHLRTRDRLRELLARLRLAKVVASSIDTSIDHRGKS